MITPRTETLIFDMLDVNVYEEMGVGLAASLQVGILKRIVVIDIGEGPIIMINPEILEDIRGADRRRGMLKPFREIYVL